MKIIITIYVLQVFSQYAHGDKRNLACLPTFDSEIGKKSKRTKEEVGRQHQGMNRSGVWQVLEWRTGKTEKTSCKVICGNPMTLIDL